MTLLSLEIGVCRTAPFVALVRVTPLGPASVVERNLEVFVDFAAGSLEGPGACSFALPLPSSSGWAVPGAGGNSGATSGFGGFVVGGNSGESDSLDGCGSGIVGATGGTGSGSDAGTAGGLEVEGSSGYGSAGIGGSTETDLDRAVRWEGGVGDLEGSGKDNGFGCGGIRCEGCLVGLSLGSRFGTDGGLG